MDEGPKEYAITARVAQGSLLGTLLVMSYIILIFLFPSQKTTIIGFADDLTVEFYATKTMRAVKSRKNADLVRVEAGLITNRRRTL